MSENYTLKIDAGSDVEFGVAVKDEATGEYEDYSNYTARMMMKRKYKDETPLISLTSSANGGITFEKTSDKSLYDDMCVVHITAEQTELLVNYMAETCGDIAPNQGVYDLELVDSDGYVTRLIRGNWIAYPEATK